MDYYDLPGRLARKLQNWIIWTRESDAVGVYGWDQLAMVQLLRSILQTNPPYGSLLDAISIGEDIFVGSTRLKRIGRSSLISEVSAPCHYLCGSEDCLSWRFPYKLPNNVTNKKQHDQPDTVSSLYLGARDTTFFLNQRFKTILHLQFPKLALETFLSQSSPRHISLAIQVLELNRVRLDV